MERESAPARAGDAAAADTAADTSAIAPALTRVWGVVGSVVAPATLMSALLFYFGYVSARAQYAYFGVDVDTLGFSTQEFVMRAPQPLLVPTLVLLVGAATMTWADAALRRWTGGLPARTARRVVTTVVAVGAALLVAGMGLLLAFPAVGSWPPYPLVTPSLVAVGAGLLAVAATWRRGTPGLGRTTVVLLVLVVVASLFWVTATLAEWSGRGRAKALARDLTVLPAVVVDTTDPLFPGDEAVVETAFPPEEGQTYQFRYRGLRLLAEGEGRLFLVPERWSPSGSTFLVSLDEARVRFRFVDDAP